jgi:small conductance mechanosensitive channel
VNLGIRCHTANDDWFVTKCELTERIKKAFDKGGIAIPFPQRDVHMYHHVAGDAAGEFELVPVAGGDPGRVGARRIGTESSKHRPQSDPE